MLEWRSYVVGTCHGMSPKVMLMRGVASADMPWHVPTAMGAFLNLVTLTHVISLLRWVHLCVSRSVVRGCGYCG